MRGRIRIRIRIRQPGCTIVVVARLLTEEPELEAPGFMIDPSEAHESLLSVIQ
jgi:hypothetical protein